MSNLSSSVKFDVIRGWPHGSAVDESVAPAPGVEVQEGQLVTLGATGAALVSSVPTEGGTARTMFRMVIQGNDQSDADFVGKVVVLRGDLTVETEKFVAGAYAVGDYVTASAGVGTEGYITVRTGANEQIVGQVEAYDATAGVLTVALKL